MRYKITGRNIEVTPALKAAVEDKIGKLERYFNQDTEAVITLSVEKDRQKIEVTIPVKGTIIRAEQHSNDMYVSIDLVEEIIERQLKKYKNKIIDKKQAAVAFSDLFINEDYEADDGIEIVKVKKFAMKPMDPEEACVQMELLGHAFYVFLNSETEQVNVVYKRKGNTYGLIEPAAKASTVPPARGCPAVFTETPRFWLRLNRNQKVTVQTCLRTCCADRTKTWQQQISAPSRSDFHGQMP